MSNLPSRRAIVAGLGSAPLVGLRSKAFASSPDPALQALEKHQRLRAIEKAAWDAASAATKVINAERDKFERVTFDGVEIYSLEQLEILRERTCGMTDEEVEEVITRLRQGTALKRAEGAAHQQEYLRARSAVEGRNVSRDEAAQQSAWEAEQAAQEAQELSDEAERTLFETSPTTHAGAIALLKHAADHLAEIGINDSLLEDVFVEGIRNAIAILEGAST